MALKAGSGYSNFSVNWGLSQDQYQQVQILLVNRRPAMVLPRMELKVAESSKKLVSSDMIVILFSVIPSTLP
jgi:hypothetical protein